VMGNISPTSKIAGEAAFTLTVNGTGFVNGSVVKWNDQARATSFVSSTQLTAQITSADIVSAGPASVTVFSPTPGGGTSTAASFTVNVNPRTVSAGSTSGSGTISVPIVMTAQGDENALGMTITFDPALLSNPQATLGADAAAATLNTNSAQAAQGRYGIAMSLPAGSAFAAGTRQLLTLTFTTAAVGAQTSTQVGFADLPVPREVSNSVAEPLLTAYTPGTVTITLGYEADVAPRPNGSNNGTITIADWTQTGRFASGLDTVNPGSEFQRADCAPRSTFGGGSITIADWVQAGRYASGLDPVTAAAGPTTQGSAPQNAGPSLARANESALVKPSQVSLVSTILPQGQKSTVSIEFDAQGNENAFGFSLMYDPKKLSFVSAEKSVEASAGTLNVNSQQTTNGRVGIALALPAGQTFGAGRHQLVVLTFVLRTNASDLPLIGFADQPIRREVVDLDANSLRADFEDLLGANPIDDAQFFVAQQYLDFLNRLADSAELDHGTDQIKQCGTDAACISQKRIAVSAAFFTGQEFQQTGYAVYRLYKAAYGRRLTFAEFSSALNQLTGGERLPSSMLEFAAQFVSGPEFKKAYPDSMPDYEFVNRLYETAGLSQAATEKLQAIEALKGGRTRAQILMDLIEIREFKDREYNPAFVLMQYFGYLRRDPDEGGYDFWLNVLNTQPGDSYKGMVCSFITSREYQERFSKIVTRTNQDCGP
jgi:hypothetical protein